MPQNFNSIATSTKLQDSLTPLLDRDEAARSCFSGTVFPSTNLVLGMLCYRTDVGFKGLYQLTQITPSVVWSQLADLTVGDARYVKRAGDSEVAGNIIFDATSVERALVFKPSAVANRLTYLYGQPSEIVGMWNQRNNLNVWYYVPVTNIFEFGNVTLQRSGKKIWHEDNDGSGSGLDADKLDGQDGSYYLTWANISGKPAFSDAATTSVATIQAGVSVSSRVAKSGDTMSGALNLAVDLWNYDNLGQARLLYQSGVGGGTFLRANGPIVFQRETSDPSAANTLAAYTDGRVWTSAYGYMDECFARRTPAAKMAPERVVAGAGDLPLERGIEVADIAYGVHQTRWYTINCTNCNCTVNC